MLGLSTKERKAKFNTDDMIFRKRFSLPSRTLLSLSSHVDIERSSAEYKSAESLTNKYKLFGTKSKQIVNFPNIPEKPFPSTPSKKYIMIKEVQDRIKGLKNILNEMKKKLESLREQEINEIKNETKRKLNMLDDEINNILETLDVDLTTLITKCKFFEKPYEYNSIKKERKLKILAKERINEIKRFKKEA